MYMSLTEKYVLMIYILLFVFFFFFQGKLITILLKFLKIFLRSVGSVTYSLNCILKSAKTLKFLCVNSENDANENVHVCMLS